MQKIGSIICFLLVVTGCSVIKRVNGVDGDNIVKGNGKPISEFARDRNITDNSFYIKNMEIVIKKGEESGKLLGSLKFERPDKFLISLRSRSGIEISRIFINRDSVYIVDRLKKKVYTGTVNYVGKKYGIPFSMFPVLLGDFIGVCGSENYTDRKDEGMIFKCSVNGISLNYEIDKGIEKVKKVYAENRYGNTLLSADFGKFKKVSTAIFPSKINWDDLERSIKVEISIKKIEYPWNDKLEFSYSNRYEVIELL